MIEKMQRIARTLVHKGAILDVYQDTMEFKDGHTEEWDFLAHRKGAAAVLPVLEDGRIVMVRQYRPALDRETLEIPAGCRDSLSEDTKETVRRELAEETGYNSEKISFLLSLKTAVAFCNEFVDVYVAEDLTPGQQHLDPEESIDVEIYELKDLLEMVYAGKIQDAKTVAALTAYALKKR